MESWSEQRRKERRIEPEDVTPVRTLISLKENENSSTAIPATSNDPESGIIQSVDRALSIVEEIALAGRPLRLVEISEATGLRTTTCFTLLNTLVRRGFVRRNPYPKVYYLGRRLAELARDGASGIDLETAATGRLRDLSLETGLTSALAMFHGSDLRLVASARPPDPGTISLDDYRAGISRASHASALGKAILAWLPEGRIAGVVAQHDLTAFNARSIDALGELAESLRQVRRHGFAVEDGEYIENISGVAVAIREPSGGVLVSVGCLMPRDSDSIARMRTIRHQLAETAGEIAMML